MFRFASPWFFLLLIVLPLVFLWHKRRHTSLHVMVSHGVPSDGIQSNFFVLMLSAMLPVLKYTALALMIVALARPQWGTRKMNVSTEGINIVLAMDLSQSMAALDFKRGGKIISRLDAVKGVVNDFIMKRNQDRIGMVVFGSQAFTQLPLTRDYSTISFVLDHLKIGAAGPSTAIGDALGIAFKRLLDIKSKSNVIILLTDGRSNSGKLSPEEAADIAAAGGVKVYTIGVGSRGKAPFLVNDPLLGQRYVYQHVDIDYNTLKKIAKKTGGMFFAAENIDQLQQIYDSIDRLEKTRVDVDAWAEYNDLYPWCIIPAMFLLGAYIILFNTRLMRIP